LTHEISGEFLPDVERLAGFAGEPWSAGGDRSIPRRIDSEWVNQARTTSALFDRLPTAQIEHLASCVSFPSGPGAALGVGLLRRAGSTDIAGSSRFVKRRAIT
jgi:hypothetical protein